MLLTHSYSSSKKTKYFGVKINSDFIKLNSKKATVNLLLAVTNNKQVTISENCISVEDDLISKITRINSYKLFNYLTNNYSNVKYQSRRNQKSIRSNNNSSRICENNKNNNQRNEDTALLQAVTTVIDSVSDIRPEDSLSLTVRSTEIQYDDITSTRDFRVLPTSQSSFYGIGIIEAIGKLVTDFTNAEPGAVERMYRFERELDYCRSNNLINDSIYSDARSILESKLQGREAELESEETNLRIRELDRKSEENHKRFREQLGEKRYRKLFPKKSLEICKN